jgi:NAD-dependent SIR2 family protein deacetylase
MRVYFLGAGASKSFYSTLPTATELTLESLLHPFTYESLDQTPPDNAIEAVRSFAASKGLSETQRRQPLEEILDVFEGHRYEYLSLQFCLLGRLWIADHTNTSLLKSWLGRVRQNGDTIITTNYDTVLERGISKLTKSPDSRPMAERGLLNYGVEPGLLMPGYEKLARDAVPESITLLKLHGSISWSYCANCGRAKLHPVYKNEGMDALAGKQCDCGGELSPILVGPAKKQYEHPVIASVVNTASRRLQQASEIIFVGFSMTSGDEMVRKIVTEADAIARTRQVILVDPLAERLKSVYENIYGKTALNVIAVGWQEYLQAGHV